MPNVSELMLTPGNVDKVAKQLSALRGAAMKIGQLLSIDSGDLLPEELERVTGGALLRETRPEGERSANKASPKLMLNCAVGTHIP